MGLLKSVASWAEPTNSDLVDIVGNTTIRANLNVSGNSILNGPITGISSLNISGRTTLLGAVTAVSTLNVSGESTLLGATTALSTLNVSFPSRFISFSKNKLMEIFKYFN